MKEERTELCPTTNGIYAWSFMSYIFRLSFSCIRRKLYHKRDDFNFPKVNFPFICSNIVLALAYCVYLLVDKIFQNL
jgi:hypothetical protein